MDVNAPSGVIQTLPVQTQNGENHVFSPPEGWSGNGKQYRELIRQRYDTHLSASQQIVATAISLMSKSDPESHIAGPFQKEAYQICQYLAL